MRMATSLIALSLGMAGACPSFAQIEPQGASTSELDEVVVTARRRAENLQTVPVAVTAFTGPELRNQSVVRLEDIQRATPNLRMRDGGGNSSAAIFSIRGQVNNEIIATQDSSVGLYVDDLIWARAIGANATLLDIGSVQVLKGPQGTLFGRNTTGGALVLRTNDPQTDAFGGSVSLGYGRFNRREGTAVLNVPINKRVALRGAIKRVKADAAFDNDFGPDQGEEDTTVGRVKLLVEPIDTVRVVASYENFRMDQAAAPWFLQFYNTGAAGANATIASQGTAFGPIQTFVRGADLTKALNRDPQDTYAKTETYNGVLEWDVGGATLKAIVGRRDVFHDTVQDLDGTPYRIQTSAGKQKIRQTSGEVQLVGKLLDDRLDYALGLFAFREKGYDTSTSFSLPGINPSNPNFTLGDVNNSSRAAYAQVTYKITDEVSFTGGLRYSKDKKQLISQNSSGAGATFSCSIPVALRVAGATCLSVPLKASADGLSYTAGLDYQATPGVMVYAKTSRGFRSGGFNLRASGNAALFQPFRPEEVTDYELGFKSEFLDRRVRLNVAAFYSDYKDIQRNQNITVPTATGGIATISIVANAATARIMGGEAELDALVTDNLRIFGSLGLTAPKYKRFTEPRIVGGQTIIFDRSGENFDFVPKTTASFGAEYKREVSFGKLLLRADYTYTSRLHFQSPFTPAPEPERDQQKPIGLVNLRAGVTLGEHVDLAVYGRNVLGERYKSNALDFSQSLGIAVGIPAPRPTYGVEATYTF
jgi:iron complex outermembrane recepter protein